MDKGVVYDAVSDVDGIFPSEFRNYVLGEKLICHYWNMGFDYGIWLFRQNQQHNGVNSSKWERFAHCDLTNKLMTMFQSFPYVSPDCLVQFWKAEELTGVDNLGERRFLLTTRNQPFLISGPSFENPRGSKVNCLYRMKIVDIVTGDAGGGGVIGRVYRSKRIEYAPNIGYYSLEEYPNRDLALSCGIKCSVAIPISDSFGHLVGVLEAGFEYRTVIYFLESLLLESWRGSNCLRYLDHCKDLCGHLDLKAGSRHLAVSEIKRVMEVIGERCNIVFSQTWVLCNSCSSLRTVRKSLNGEVDASYSKNFVTSECFYKAEHLCTLKKGEGVVGKAATSPHKLVYCEDVSQFNIIEYPLAHLARHYNHKSCFAICLKSDLRESRVYVLEFFLDLNGDNGRDLRAMLVPILDCMKQNFRTFKVASGEEIGDNLYVQVIDARSSDKIIPLRNRELDLTLSISINNIESSTYETDDPMIGVETSVEDTSMEETSDFSAFTVQSKCWLTIKVNYGGDLFTFQLSSSSDILELSQQVSRRLNLEGGTYDIKYRDDDNDWILLTCDEDLCEYIESSTRQEKYTLMMTIEPK